MAAADAAEAAEVTEAAKTTQLTLFTSKHTFKFGFKCYLGPDFLKAEFYLGAGIAQKLLALYNSNNTLDTNESYKHSFCPNYTFLHHFICSSMGSFNKKKLSSEPMLRYQDSDFHNMLICISIIAAAGPSVDNYLPNRYRAGSTGMPSTHEAEEQCTRSPPLKHRRAVVEHVDDHIVFSHLTKGNDLSSTDDMFDLSMSMAVSGSKKEGIDLSTSKLSKAIQTEYFFTPPQDNLLSNIAIYAIIPVMVLKSLRIPTFSNCTLELATLGDLKLVEKPQPVVLAPQDFCNIKANVKVASTENGFIFGNIVYDVKGSTSDRNVVILNDIHVDIMDYIVPASCTDLEFRQMWLEFEWENKVTVNTHMTELKPYLEYLCKSTNMKCLTPEKALSGTGDYMAANLYARSIFGEDALANLSIEKPLENSDSPVTGHIRIRAKSQGMAISLGDKINKVQKATLKSVGA
ncbi:unnamed protein product, partial [Meganyctiphanes norvegica]